MYEENQIMPIFKTYEGIGHWAKADINLDVVMNISSVKCNGKTITIHQSLVIWSYVNYASSKV